MGKDKLLDEITGLQGLNLRVCSFWETGIFFLNNFVNINVYSKFRIIFTDN